MIANISIFCFAVFPFYRCFLHSRIVYIFTFGGSLFLSAQHPALLNIKKQLTHIVFHATIPTMNRI